MYILACDTAHNLCSVALLRDGKVLATLKDDQHGRQAERLLDMLGELMTAQQVSYKDIGALAVNIGPGSFTGIRIGLAAMKGIRLVIGLPLIAVTTLEAVAFEHKALVVSHRRMAIFLDARRGQSYHQSFGIAGQPVSDAVMLDNATLFQHITPECAIVSELDIDTTQAIVRLTVLPDAAIIGQVAWEKHQSNQWEEADIPLYIRPPDTSLPKGKTSFV